MAGGDVQWPVEGVEGKIGRQNSCIHRHSSKKIPAGTGSVKCTL